MFDLKTQIKRSAPDQISGIILIGGAIDELTTEVHDDVTLGHWAKRMTATLELIRLYPNTPLIFTGFSSRLVRGKLSESDVALRFFLKKPSGQLSESFSKTGQEIPSKMRNPLKN